MVKLGDWLSEGWGLIKDDIVTFAVAALLAGLIGGVTIGICAPAMMVGLYMMVNSRMRGEPVEIGDVFKGFQKFGPAFVAALLIGIASFAIGFLAGYIPVVGGIIGAVIGWVISGAMFYMYAIIAVQQVGSIEAISISWEKTKPDLAMYTVTCFVYSLISALGIVACFVGVFVTMPLMVAAIAVAYRDNFGLEGTAAAPAAPPAAPAETPVPPPPAAPAPEPPAPTPEPPAPEPSDEPPTPAE